MKQAPVVQRVDGAIQWITHAIGFDSIYPLDSSFHPLNNWTRSVDLQITVICNNIFRKKLAKNFTVALEASLLGQLFIFRTIFQPRALSSDIPASRKGVYLFYNPPINFSRRTYVDRSCMFCGFFFVCFSVRNCQPVFYLSVTGFCKKSFWVFLDQFKV